MASATLSFFPAFSSVYSTYLSSVLSTRPRQFLYSLQNESNIQTVGTPIPFPPFCLDKNEGFNFNIVKLHITKSLTTGFLRAWEILPCSLFDYNTHTRLLAGLPHFTSLTNCLCYLYFSFCSIFMQNSSIVRFNTIIQCLVSQTFRKTISVEASMT